MPKATSLCTSLKPRPQLPANPQPHGSSRSEEHTSELQSRLHLVCRLLLEKKKKQNVNRTTLSSMRDGTDNVLLTVCTGSSPVEPYMTLPHAPRLPCSTPSPMQHPLTPSAL